MELLNTATIACAGLMTGNEFAVAALIHPTLERLPDDVHLAGASAIARVLGRFMPFGYGLVLLLSLADALSVKHAAGHWPVLIACSAVLWAVCIAYTVAALVPINNRIAAWPDAPDPPDWKSYRHRWDVLHRWRVLLLAVSFVLLILGICGAFRFHTSSNSRTRKTGEPEWLQKPTSAAASHSRKPPYT